MYVPILLFWQSQKRRSHNTKQSKLVIIIFLDCNLFAVNVSFEGMKFSNTIITTMLQIYYLVMSIRDIQNHCDVMHQCSTGNNLHLSVQVFTNDCEIFE